MIQWYGMIWYDMIWYVHIWLRTLTLEFTCGNFEIIVLNV